MSQDAQSIVNLVRSMESQDMSEGQKGAIGVVVEKKGKELKAKKEAAGKKINVSSTDRKTGAPVVKPIEEIEDARAAELQMLEDMDASEEANYGVNSEEARQDKIKEVNDRYDSKRAKLESPQDFEKPDAAQGFEEFFDAKEVEITSEDDAQENAVFEDLKNQIPDIKPEEVGELVQKRKDNKGREVKTYSRTEKKDGVDITEYYSERDGEVIPTGGVVFEDKSKSNFDKLLDTFNIPREKWDKETGGDAEFAALLSSQTDGDKGSINVLVKKPTGNINIEIPFTETKKATAAPKAKVDKSLSEAYFG